MCDKLQLKKYKAEVEHRIFILHYYHYQGISLTI